MKLTSLGWRDPSSLSILFFNLSISILLWIKTASNQSWRWMDGTTPTTLCGSASSFSFSCSATNFTPSLSCLIPWLVSSPSSSLMSSPFFSLTSFNSSYVVLFGFLPFMYLHEILSMNWMHDIFGLLPKIYLMNSSYSQYIIPFCVCSLSPFKNSVGASLKYTLYYPSWSVSRCA